MRIFDVVREFLGQHPKCEKLIQYQDRIIDFKGLGVDVPGFNFSLANFHTEKKTLESACESAKALDDYQYYLCLSVRTLPDRYQELLIKTRIVSLGLLTSFRITLEAFTKDPEGQRNNLDVMVKRIQEFVNELQDVFLDPSEIKSDKVQRSIDEAISSTETQERENLESLIAREVKKLISGLGEQKKVLIEVSEKLDNIRQDVQEIKGGSYGQALVSDSDIRIVDIGVIEKNTEFTKLDIKLRNIGAKLGFLKRLEIEVSRIWVFRYAVMHAAVPVSHDYNIILPATGAPYTKSIEISQAIPANSFDRFTLTIGIDHGPSNERYVYKIRIAFVLDENDKVIYSKELLVMVEKAWHIQGATTFGGEEAITWLRENINNMKEMQQVDAVRSPWVSKAIQEQQSRYPYGLVMPGDKNFDEALEGLSVKVMTDRSAYNDNDSIRITGTVKPCPPGFLGKLELHRADGTPIRTELFEPFSNEGRIEEIIHLIRPNDRLRGRYTLKIYFGNSMKELFFDYDPSLSATGKLSRFFKFRR